MSKVSLQAVSKTYTDGKGQEVSAVDRVSFEVAEREFLVLVGPSGCGKSTTLRMIAGLEEISAGEIAIDGRRVNDVPPKDRDIAMVFQSYALYPHMSVYENMAFGLKLRRMPKAEIDQRVREAAAILGLEAYLERRPKALSGGQRQRVAVGRAIVRQPKVFLFDEPLSNLDAKMRVQTRMELIRLHQRLQATMIYVTHDQVEAMTMGTRIAVMQGGVLQQIAPPLELYHQPANLFVAGFLGSPPMNFVHGTLTRSGAGEGGAGEGGGGGGAGAGWRFEEKGGATAGAAGAAGVAGAGAKTGARAGAAGVTCTFGLKERAAYAAYEGREVILGVRPEDIFPLPLASGGGASTGHPASSNPAGTTGAGATGATGAGASGAASAGAGEGRGEFGAVIDIVEPMGAETNFYLQTGAHTLICRCQESALGGPSLASSHGEQGHRRRFAFEAARAHLFDPATTKRIV